ncbi:MAG: hypothetical protein O3C46_07135, partial [Bacteroidetes bacterium]|nr:hypothetical protein [Bacteroidota bacterium]
QHQQQQQQQQQQQNQQPENKPNNQPNSSKQNIKKQDAERILDALNRQEKEAQKNRDKDSPSGSMVHPEKDW